MKVMCGIRPAPGERLLSNLHVICELCNLLSMAHSYHYSGTQLAVGLQPNAEPMPTFQV